MSPNQRVLFTALPNGPDPNVAGRYSLSVHISPRLTNDDVETNHLTFPDWLDWPAAVSTIGWSVAFGGGPSVPATVVSAAPRSDLWVALFAPSTLVRSHAPTYYHERKVRSYPARNVREFIRTLYSNIAVGSPTDFPHIDDLVAELGRISPNDSDGSSIGGFIESTLANGRVVTNGEPLVAPAEDFYQLVRFHQPRVSDTDKLATPVPKPVLDFHEAVSTLGQHPPLLRLLGLAVDLQFDLGGLPPSPSEVRVLPTWAPSPPLPEGSSTIVSVRTRCVISPSAFRARPAPLGPAELVDGRLTLEDTARFTVIQEDVDGAAMKLVDFAANLTRLKTNGKSVASPDEYSLPSLRSGGLQVARSNRAVQFHERMGLATSASQQVDADPPGELVVNAEEITRGYRIDIRDTREGKWFSLCARTGSYRFLATGDDVAFSDEAWVTAAPTEDEASDLYLQETLFRWGGWSLAAPRPGGRLAITQEDDPPVTNEPPTAGADFPVLIEPKATPGSLPRLRFGRTYEVRARAVDLAGNSAALDPGNRDPHASPPVGYARFEPVQTPPVLPHGPRTEGESLERVVLRSNYNTDPEPGVVARHIVPPKASELMAEQHGLFDTPFPASIVDPASYPTISAYPGLTPPDGPVVQSEQGDFLLSSEGVNDPDDHQKTRYFPVELVSLPYLPDPIARGAALRFLDHPGGRNFLLKVPFTPEPAWPKHLPVRLVLRPAPVLPLTPRPSYDPVTHQVSVPLGKGDVVHVRLSAYLERADLDKLGIWDWIVDAVGSGLAPQVVDGGHWMITPFRTLTLVHAVRQPLTEARFANLHQGVDLRSNKGLGDTFVTFDGSLNYSRKSTSRIDVVASWDDWVDHGPGDDLPDPTPATPPRARRAFPFSIPSDRPPLQPQFPDRVPLKSSQDRQEFGDTKHRRVDYTTVATTRFAEYFVQRAVVIVNYKGKGSVKIPLDTGGEGIVPGSVNVKNEVVVEDDGRVTGAGTYVESTHFTVDNGLSLVEITKGPSDGGFVPEGQAVVITYLVPPLTRPAPGEAMVPVTLNILSSARPAAPKVLYVVPIFGWQGKRFPPSLTNTSKRTGGGLRVYLERPWWTSGEGELLGVVLAPYVVTEALASSVTHWGVDPVFRSTELSDPTPRLTDFPLVVEAAAGLTLPGVAEEVGVVGHEVSFDTVRELWYCDIQVETSSYFPFMRLALARFQPDSVAGVHLSPVVVTDFVQLTPDRTVSTAPAGTGRVKVTVTGPSYDRAGGDNNNNKALVRVTVEESEPAVGGDLGWVATPNSVNLDSKPPVGDNSVWSGEISIKAAKAGVRRRLLVQEFERHRTGATPVFGERLVFADTIELPLPLTA